METGVGSTPKTDVKVRPLDTPEPPWAPPPRAGRGIVTVLVAIGALAVGLLVGSGVRDGATATPLTKLGLAAEERGLASAIDGLDDALLVVATNGGRAMDVVMWPPSGALSLRPAPVAWSAVTIDGLPFEDFAAFDSSGRYVALAAPVAAESTAVLMAGRLEEQVVVASRVTGYAWHVSEPHQLAIAIEEDDVTSVEVMLGAPMSVMPVTELQPGAKLRAWGPWGFLTSQDGFLALSSVEFGVEGEFLGAGREVIVVATDGGVGVFPVGHRGGPSTSLAFDGHTAAVESETGRIAVGGPEGLLVVTAEGEPVVELEHPFVERLDWSSDGRFIVFADRVDVFILDLETGEVTPTGLGPTEAVMFRPPAG